MSEMSFNLESQDQGPGAEVASGTFTPKLYWLMGVLAVAFALRFSLAVLSPNVFRPDEVFENLEPAFRMVTGHGVMSWEWHSGLRSPMFPGFLAGLILLSNWLGLGVRGYLAVIAAVMSLISLGVVAVGFLEGWRQWGLRGAMICGTACAVWPDLVYFGPKALAEVQAAHLLVIAIYLALIASRGLRGEGTATLSDRNVARRMFVSGVVLGLAFTLRFHLGPVLLLVAVWICRKEFRRLWLPLALGSLVPVLAMGLIDLAYWGTFFATVWRSYRIEILEHVASRFGVLPWYAYAQMLRAQWRLVGCCVLLVTFLMGLRRAPLFASVGAAVIVMHSCIQHKEFSFIYAAIPPIIIVAGLGTAELVRLWKSAAAFSGLTVVAACVMWAALGYRVATRGLFATLWTREQPVLRAQMELQHEPGLCGVGLRYPAIFWAQTGGDIFLGRGVPFYVVDSAEDAKRVGDGMNVILGGTDVAEGLPGYSVQQCWGPGARICMARPRVAQGCEARPELDLNRSVWLGLPQPPE